MTDYYRLQDFLTVEVSSGAAHIREGYRHYFRHFLADSPSQSQVIYRVRDFKTFQLPTDHRRYGPYIGFSSGFFIPQEKYAIIVRDGEVEEYTTYANRATNAWMQTLLIPQGVSLVHGAGVRLGEKGVLLAGFGGVGKTLLISEFKKRSDTIFFGDDYVMVDGQGRMFAYPTDFSIYYYHLAAFPELKGTPFARYLRRRRAFSFYYNAKRAVNFFTKRLSPSGEPVFSGWLAPYAKVPAEFLVPKTQIGVREHLDALVFLTRYPGTKPVLEEITAGEFAAALMGNLQIELTQALPYFNLLQTLNLFNVADFFTRQLSILEQCASSTKRFRLSIPQHTDIRDLAPTVIDHVQHIL